MKTRFNSHLVALSLVLFGAGHAGAASTWSFTGGGGSESGAGTYGNTRGYVETGGSGALQASAWSNTVGTANTQLESAYLGANTNGNPGLGVINPDGRGGLGDNTGSNKEGTPTSGSTPGDAMDNDVRKDSMLFDFGVGRSFTLSNVTVGWWSGDSDITVLAYTGSGTPTFTSLTNGYADLLSNGWSVVKGSAGTTGTAHYSNAAGGAPAQSTNTAGYVATAVNDLNISARYWLIGALNTAIQTLPGGATVNGGDDFVKIAGLSGTYRIPEPSGIALGGVALAGVVALRRRRAG